MTGRRLIEDVCFSNTGSLKRKEFSLFTLNAIITASNTWQNVRTVQLIVCSSFDFVALFAYRGLDFYLTSFGLQALTVAESEVGNSDA
jgi:hypothetical protein